MAGIVAALYIAVLLLAATGVPVLATLGGAFLYCMARISRRRRCDR